MILHTTFKAFMIKLNKLLIKFTENIKRM